MTLTLDEARKRAQVAIDENADPNTPLALGPEPLESPHYWVFFYNTVEFWETGDFLASLAGNGPVVVPKDGGPLLWMSSATDPEEQLAELEASFSG